MKKWFLGIAVLGFLASMLVWSWAATPAGTKAASGSTHSQNVTIAFSLKVVQHMLQANPQASQQDQNIKHLAGITQIQGYVIDEAKQDIILFGQRDPSLPPIYLEDFVVALRNAMYRYATRKGNTVYYSYPGCSIDPDPQVIARLDDVSRRINKLTGRRASQEAINREFQNWHQTCRAPQAVRVLGIPYDTRFAWVMVKADYDMKQLVDGSDNLDIQDFVSLTGMKMALAKQDIVAGQPISIPLASMNRFWFHPGPNLYKEDDGVAVIDKCPVILLTEEEHLTRTGEIKGTGAPDPFALQFTKDFSSHYQEIAVKRPIYAQLEGLFRFVALAKIIKFKDAEREAGLRLDYLLNQYAVPEVRVSQQLPGRSHIPEFAHQYQDGSSIRLWLPSCGGVGIELNLSPSLFIYDPAGTLKGLKKEILDFQPSPQKLFWEIPSRLPGEVRIRHNEWQLG